MNNNSPLSINAVMAAMANYAEAQADENAACARHEGYSWDYYGRDYILATEKAEEKAKKVLQDYINLCVGQALIEAGVIPDKKV